MRRGLESVQGFDSRWNRKREDRKSGDHQGKDGEEIEEHGLIPQVDHEKKESFKKCVKKWMRKMKVECCVENASDPKKTQQADVHTNTKTSIITM